MLIGMNWIRKTDVTIKKERMKFNVIENEIFKWLENLKEIFKIILEGKLSFSYERVNYEITLKTREIKSLLLILIRLKKQ